MTCAAILTGGLARRFHGRDKSRLVVASGPSAGPGAGGSILDRQLALLAPLAAEILIVTSAARAADFSGTPARVVLDAYPESGPLGAIVTALDEAASTTLIVVAGDMPHLSAPLLETLVQLHDRSGNDATVPESPRGLEPLCAVYAGSARSPLAAALESGDLSVHRALRALRLGIMPAGRVAEFGDPAILFRNINAAEDL